VAVRSLYGEEFSTAPGFAAAGAPNRLDAAAIRTRLPAAIRSSASRSHAGAGVAATSRPRLTAVSADAAARQDGVVRDASQPHRRLFFFFLFFSGMPGSAAYGTTVGPARWPRRSRSDVLELDDARSRDRADRAPAADRGAVAAFAGTERGSTAYTEPMQQTLDWLECRRRGRTGGDSRRRPRALRERLNEPCVCGATS